MKIPDGHDNERLIMSTTYGVFFAILPVQPSISTGRLREACNSVTTADDFELE